MVQTRASKSDREWLELIQECRTSGLSDKEWCEANGIVRSSFYYHVRRLRQKACEVPQASRRAGSAIRQEVVPVEILDDGAKSYGYGGSPDTARVEMRVHMGNICIEILEGATGPMVKDVLSALGGLAC